MGLGATGERKSIKKSESCVADFWLYLKDPSRVKAQSIANFATPNLTDFQAQFPTSIKKIKVGFMSPHPEKAKRSPVYEDVCRGSTWQVDVAYIELNDPEEHYEVIFLYHDTDGVS